MLSQFTNTVRKDWPLEERLRLLTFDHVFEANASDRAENGNEYRIATMNKTDTTKDKFINNPPTFSDYPYTNARRFHLTTTAREGRVISTVSINSDGLLIQGSAVDGLYRFNSYRCFSNAYVWCHKTHRLLNTEVNGT